MHHKSSQKKKNCIIKNIGKVVKRIEEPGSQKKQRKRKRGERPAVSKNDNRVSWSAPSRKVKAANLSLSVSCNWQLNPYFIIIILPFNLKKKIG